MNEPVKVIPRSIVCTWKDNQWDIAINDEEGRQEITPRQKNLLMQKLSLSLSRRYRHHRVRARGVVHS